jgi:hypothetical protein
MPLIFWRQYCAALCVAVITMAAAPAFAQSSRPGNAKQPAQPLPDLNKERQKAIDELAEADRVLSGRAGNAECVWLGRRVVTLMWRDDIDTALRHLTLYDRFRCPPSHIQAAFRCVVKQGPLDPKAAQTLNARVFACWLHPNETQAPASATAAPAGAAPPAR